MHLADERSDGLTGAARLLVGASAGLMDSMRSISGIKCMGSAGKATESEELAVSPCPIVVLPLQRLGVLVVFADVAHELLVEVFDGGETPRLITSLWMGSLCLSCVLGR